MRSYSFMGPGYASIRSVFSRRKPDLDLEKQRGPSWATFDYHPAPLFASNRVRRVSIFSTTTSTPVILAIPDRRPACSRHSNIYATSTTRLRRPPIGRGVPQTDVHLNVHSQSIPVVSDEVQRSNIAAVSVSPGISRTDVITPLLAADSSRGSVSWAGANV